MRAVEINGYGGPEVMHLRDVPIPEIRAGELLVRVKAAGINPVDWKIRDGLIREWLPISPPFILGCDISGVVEAVADGVSGFTPGDEVFGQVGGIGDSGLLGGYADYARFTPNRITHKPASISHVEATSVPVAGITAWQALFRDADLQPGQRILIHAAAGGLGSFAVQMAHDRGAYVVATASAANLDYVRGLGADEVIDYRAKPFEEQTGDFDLILDLVSGDTERRSWPLLRPGGKLLSTVRPPSQDLAAQHGVSAGFVVGAPDA